MCIEIDNNILVLMFFLILFILAIYIIKKQKSKKEAELKKKEIYLNFYKAIEQEFKEKADAKQNG